VIRWSVRLLAVTLAVGGCSFDTSGIDVNTPTDGGVDGGDGPAPGVDAACPGQDLRITPSNVDRCAIPSPGGVLSIPPGNWTLDTTALTLQDDQGSSVELSAAAVPQATAGAPELAVVSVDRLTIASGANVHMVGARALVLVSFGDATIDGNLDASAAGALAGAGAGSDALCGIGLGAPGVEQNDSRNSVGGAGAGGGGFGAPGGQGAIVNDSAGAEPSLGGDRNGNAEIVPLRGGCHGGKGGHAGGGDGGAGGAIQIVSGARVRIGGILSVAGGGGAGANGSNGGGGGGGGSGGAILIEADRVEISGKLTANGGGGGEGKLTSNGDVGDNGRRDTADAAAGGDGGVFQGGGNGGNGAAGATAAADGAQGGSSILGAAGGGGGGGGPGRIHLNGAVNVGGGALLSPQPQ